MSAKVALPREQNYWAVLCTSAHQKTINFAGPELAQRLESTEFRHMSNSCVPGPEPEERAIAACAAATLGTPESDRIGISFLGLRRKEQIPCDSRYSSSGPRGGVLSLMKYAASRGL